MPLFCQRKNCGLRTDVYKRLPFLLFAKLCSVSCAQIEPIFQKRDNNKKLNPMYYTHPVLEVVVPTTASVWSTRFLYVHLVNKG